MQASETKTEATARPWRIGRHFDHLVIADACDSPSAKHIATAISAEHAELIVRAVNAHNALVEALQGFMQMWGSADAHSDSKRAQAKRAAMWDKVNEAMKLAGVSE